MELLPLTTLRQALLRLPRRSKQAIVVLVDTLAAWLALWLAFSLRLEAWYVPTGMDLWVWLVVPAIFIPLFTRFGLYRAIFRFTGLATLQTVIKAVTAYGAVLFAIVFVTFPAGVPRSIGILQPLLFLLLVSSTRTWAQVWLNKGSRETLRHRLLIYGAGSAGAQTASAVVGVSEFELLGFVDDDPSKVGQHVNGVPVFRPSEVAGAVERFGVTDILLALPSTSRQRRNEILASLRTLPVHIRTLPGMADLASGRVQISDFRELEIEDLLGRDPVPPNPALLARDLADKVVLVTGAGGSIGSELCRQIVHERPRRLVLVDHSEYALYAIQQELAEILPAHAPAAELIAHLADVRDYPRMLDLCSEYQPQTVYHAAAYKHVPIVENNPCEGVENNALGTLITARAAMECGVASFVLVSTDKAVRPTNVMGASKRIAEMVLQAFAVETMVRFNAETHLAGLVRNRTRFCMVRFGNVLGSSGSVVPLFRKQIETGGPVTVTHPEVTRYFMTIPEAAQLVLQAGAMGQGGEVFVLDMGEPVRIIELAARMIELSGRSVRSESNPDGDIEIAITGLRPGEKLYEELLIGDCPAATAHARIMKARESHLSWAELRPWLAELRACVDRNDAAAVLEILRRLVTGYQPSTQIVDLASAGR
jgi:FlaA1/EpsC-like NDP-sugar epimerase